MGSALIREHVRDEFEEREEQSSAMAVAKSERWSATINPDEVADVNAADRIREWRDRRYGLDGWTSSGRQRRREVVRSGAGPQAG